MTVRAKKFKRKNSILFLNIGNTKGKTQISQKLKGKTIQKDKNDDNNIKKSSIPRFVTSTQQKLSDLNIQTSNQSSPKFASKSLSPIREKFISQLLSPRKEKQKEKSPDRRNQSNNKINESISKGNLTKSSVASISTSRRGANCSNYCGTDKKNVSRRKSLPKKKQIIDGYTGIQSYVSNKIWKEIRLLQHQTKHVIPVAPFLRLVKEILMEFGGHDIRVQRAALAALQEACELYMTQFMQDSYLCTIHANRVTLMVKDMQLARRLRGPDDIVNH